MPDSYGTIYNEVTNLLSMWLKDKGYEIETIQPNGVMCVEDDIALEFYYPGENKGLNNLNWIIIIRTHLITSVFELHDPKFFEKLECFLTNNNARKKP